MQTEEQQDVDDDQLAQPAEPQLTPLGQLTPSQGSSGGKSLQLVQTEEQQDVEEDQLAHPAEPQLTEVGQVTPSQGSEGGVELQLVH